jgi:hypothetical protein
MEATLYIVPAIAFLAWGLIVFRSISMTQKARKVRGFEDCWRWSDFKRKVQENPSPEMIEVFNEMKSDSRNTLWIWAAVLVGSAIAVLTVGIITHAPH